MKKMIMAVAIFCVAAFANAAAVGWSIGGVGTAYAGDAYMFFVVGQNGVTSSSAITALLDAGTDVSSYAFGKSTVASNGAATVAPANSGKTLAAGTYTGFMVLFDSATPAVGDKYVLLEGTTGLTKTFGSTTATTSFAAGNMSGVIGDASNWKSFGAVPEPTSGLLLLLGMAGLALKRKVA